MDNLNASILAESVRHLKNAIGDKFPPLIEILNQNLCEQRITNMLKLCEFAMEHPELGLLTPQEIKETLFTAKEIMLTDSQKKRR